jgi:hypothetical protein
MTIMKNPLIPSIPWGLIAPHEAQARENHSQSLTGLNGRGGLSACEAVAIIEDRRWEKMSLAEATARLKELVDQFNGRHVPALVSAPAIPIIDRLQHAIILLEDIREGRSTPHRGTLNRIIVTLEAAKEALR